VLNLSVLGVGVCGRVSQIGFGPVIRPMHQFTGAFVL